jgi:hypothetical protein
MVTYRIRRLRSHAQGPLVKPNGTLTNDPATSSAIAFNPSLDPSHSPTPFFARRSATRHQANATWLEELSFPRFFQRRSWGSFPSQVCSH